MLRQDSISGLFIMLGVGVTIALAVWGAPFDALFIPIALLFGAGIIWMFSIKHPKNQIAVPRDKHLSVKEAQSILYYTLIALAGMAVGNLAIDGLFQPKIPTTILALDLPNVAVWFSGLMAISETMFFQGSILPFLQQHKFLAGTALILSSFVGVFYHFKVYGSDQSALIYVLLAFTLLGWAAWKTGYILPAMLAHFANNVVGSILHPLFLLILAVAVLVLYSSRNRRLAKWRI